MELFDLPINATVISARFLTSKNMITIPMEIARKFGVKPGFSFDWFDTGRPDEIAIRVIPDRKELSRRLKGAGKSYSPMRDSVHELLQERSEERGMTVVWTTSALVATPSR